MHYVDSYTRFSKNKQTCIDRCYKMNGKLRAVKVGCETILRKYSRTHTLRILRAQFNVKYYIAKYEYRQAMFIRENKILQIPDTCKRRM